jgi:hypothetical protein
VGRRGGKKVAHLMRKLDPLHFVTIGTRGGSVKSPAKKAAALRRWQAMMKEREDEENMALVVKTLATAVPHMPPSLWDKLPDELKERLRRYRR